MHPTNALYQHTLSTHPINAPYQYNLAIHSIKITYPFNIPSLPNPPSNYYEPTLKRTLLSQEELPDNVDPLYVDALMAIHSDLFILNPKSTFSWMIYVVRVALAL